MSITYLVYQKDNLQQWIYTEPDQERTPQRLTRIVLKRKRFGQWTPTTSPDYFPKFVCDAAQITYASYDEAKKALDEAWKKSKGE